MALTTNAAGQHVCHCGAIARNDGSDYAIVCTQWPICEREQQEEDQP